MEKVRFSMPTIGASFRDLSKKLFVLSNMEIITGTELMAGL